MGLAFSLARARRLGVDGELPADAVVLCSFGDASRQPRHRPGGHQHRALCRAHRPADADPVRLRGQRHRHQRADPGRLDRDDLRPPSRTSATTLADGELDEVWDAVAEAVALRAQLAPAGLPAPAAPCACGAMPAATRSRRTAPRHEIADNEARRSAAAQRAPPDRDRRHLADRPARPGGRDARAGDGRRRGGRPPAAAGHDRGGGRPRWRRTTPSRVAERAARPLLDRRRAPRGRRRARSPRHATNPDRPDAGRQPERGAGR